MFWEIFFAVILALVFWPLIVMAFQFVVTLIVLVVVGVFSCISWIFRGFQ